MATIKYECIRLRKRALKIKSRENGKKEKQKGDQVY